MKRHLTLVLAAVAVVSAGCSHGQKNEQIEQKQQAGQAQTSQKESTYNKQPQALGEQQLSPGTAQIQSQKKVLRTVIVKQNIPTVKESTIRADINKMNEKQFAALGFPSDVASNIVQYRDQKGQFTSVDDLSNVNGVTQSMLDRLGSSLGVSGSQAGQAHVDSSNLNQ